jgi:hypothetical protein
MYKGCQPGLATPRIGLTARAFLAGNKAQIAGQYISK